MAKVSSITLWREAAAVESEFTDPDREATASPLFNVPVSALGSLLGRGRRRSFPAGAMIRRQDEVSDELFYLHEGLLRQTLITTEGGEKVVGMVKPGCVFGEALFIHRCPALSNVVAVEPSIVYSFPRPVMEQLLATTPELWAQIARSLSFKVRVLTTQIWIMTSDHSTTRVRRALYALTEGVAPRAPIRLTQQEIADLAGVHRVTAATVLAELRRRGVIQTAPGTLIVKQRDRLLAADAARKTRTRKVP